MSDESIAARIERLVTEEQDLRRREQKDSPDPDALEADRERLRAVEVELNRCWGPASPAPRSRGVRARPRRRLGSRADTVEHYEQ
jgi:hypothetical protein